jgi:hypothetical protein
MPAGRNGQYCFPVTFRLLMGAKESESSKSQRRVRRADSSVPKSDAEPSPGERRQNLRPALARTAPDGYRSVSGI